MAAVRRRRRPARWGQRVSATLLRTCEFVDDQHTPDLGHVRWDIADSFSRTGSLILEPRPAWCLPRARPDARRAGFAKQGVRMADGALRPFGDDLRRAGKNGLRGIARFADPDPSADDSFTRILPSPRHVPIVAAGAPQRRHLHGGRIFGDRSGPWARQPQVQGRACLRSSPRTAILVAEDGGRVRVMISATPDACADCLVPKDLMRGILGQALGVPDDAIDLTYPADAHSSPSPAPTTRPSREVTMARRTSPPFRADHVGSLLRPQRLLQARDDLAAGRITAADLTAVEDEEIPGAIAMQEEVGLQSATDGEFRRASWHMDFIYALGGVSKAPGHLAVKFRNAAGEIEFTPASIRIDGKLRIEDTIFADAFTFTKAHVTTAVPKLTIPSPNMVHYRGGPASVDPAVYPDMEGFWADLAAAYADEVRRLGELGCAYLQFDDTSLAYLNDPAQRAEISGRGEDADHLHLRYIKQINAAIKDKPAGLAVTTHMCRGNFRSSWVASGGYDFVAEALFSELNVDGFFLEYDDERSGGFEPLRFVPPGKMVVLGLVTTKRPELESKDDLKRRIDEAAKYVPLDQICLSGQCGFSSTSEGNTLTYDEQVAKLRLIVEVARDVWGE